MEGPLTTISRANWTDAVVAVATTVGNSDELDVRNYAGGSVHVPNGSTITTLTFYALHAAGGTCVALYDADHVAVTLTVAANQVVELPASVFAIPFMKLVGNAAGNVSLFLKG